MNVGATSEAPRGRRVAILQSNYIPWKGYFDLINSVDEFVLYDTAQFTKNDWRNRNKIKTSKGPSWVTIPVRHNFGQSIEETAISDSGWAVAHWSTVSQTYAKAPCFKQYRDRIAGVYRAVANEPMLSVVNRRFLAEICDILEIKTRITWSHDYRLADGQSERLVDLCRQLGATEYLSGPAAQAYLNEQLFVESGIAVRYVDYGGYPEYRQLHPPFAHGVSILDLLFNEGTNAPRYMKTFRGYASMERANEASK
jgi:hypothetical protein